MRISPNETSIHSEDIMRINITAIAIATALFGQSAYAAPQVSASSVVNNLQFSLIDIDLTDGVLPSFSYLSGSSSATASANSPMFSDYSSSTARNTALPYMSKVAATADGQAQGVASVFANGVSASGYAIGAQSSFSATSNAINSSGNGRILLTPNSILKITGNLSTFASASTDNPGYYYYYNSGSAYASANISLNYSYYSNGTSTSSSSNASSTSQAYPYSYYYPQGRTSSDNKAFTMFFVNTSNTAQTAYLNINANVSGNMVSSVPEGETWALALAGLAVAGTVVRRRTQATQRRA